MTPARTHSLTPIRVGRRWLFADGRWLPIVSGGADEGGDVLVPEDLTLIEDAELAELEEQLVGAFDRHVDENTGDVAAMTEIAEALERVRAEGQRRDDEKSAAAEQIAALRDRVHASNDEPEPEAEEGDEDTPPEADAELEPAGATAAATPPARSIRRPASASATARLAGRPNVAEASRRVTITAAADVPGFAASAQMDLTQVATAMHDRARSLSDGSPRVSVARFHLPYAQDHHITSQMSDAAAADVIEAAVAGRGMAALTASGGWCAPSQTMYDLFDLSGQTGLLDLPSVQIDRGGIKVPDYIGIDAADGALWIWDEDDDEAAPAVGTKPCFTIPCLAWTDYRLAAYGLCLSHGNLSDRAYPELTRRYVSLVMNAHAHRMSGLWTTQIASATHSVPVTVTAAGTDSYGELMSAVELQVADYRSQHLIASSVVIEVILPAWTQEMLRADLAMRAGVDQMLSVSDAQIDAHFAARNVRPQFVEDYKPLFNATPAVVWPATTEFLLYPAGSMVEGNGGTIDLGVVRDSTLNATNDFTAAWTEDFRLLARRGPLGRKVTVTLNTTGVTGCCATV